MEYHLHPNSPLVLFLWFNVFASICFSAFQNADQQKDKITRLPGQPSNVGFDQYSGYITVNQKSGRALFYWLTEAPHPESKPLVLWLNGGPGCSSVAYGAAQEIGPFRVKPDGKTLYLNPDSWNNYQQKDKITRLPGQPSNVGFDQYSGYITVNQKAGRALFYWLTEAPHPESKPLVLWLNGGPGCSSVAYGAAQEIGPFRVKPDGKTLYLNLDSWNNLANLLFLESPAGVGFSYSNTSSDLHNAGDNRTAEDTYTFLVKWFARFPQYTNREFYIAGESYAGHYILQLSQTIYNRNKIREQKPFMNFKGFLAGNPVIDDYNDFVGTFEYWWTLGLISDSTFKSLNDKCDHGSSTLIGKDCLKYFLIAYEEMGDIDPYNIYGLTCSLQNGNNTSSLTRRSTGRFPLKIGFRGYDPCAGTYSNIYFNLPKVQEAFHANITHISYPWAACSDTVGPDTWKDSPRSMLPIYRKLIAAGLRIWVYSGNTDSVVPVSATRRSINALNLSIVKSWYPWNYKGRVGGWSQIYKGLTLVTFLGAGHEVPEYRPEEALFLLQSFLHNKLMPDAKHA